MPKANSFDIKPSPEMQLLLACMQAQLGQGDLRPPGSDLASLMVLENANIKWNRLLDLADLHKALPLLAASLKNLDSRLMPSVISQQLQTLIYQNTLNNLELTGELLHLLEVFKTHAIPVISFKGPTLEALAYGDVALRTFNDLDFLVQEADYLRLKVVLEKFGYQASHNRFIDAKGELAYRTIIGEYDLEHISKRIFLDIHVRLVAIHPFVLAADFSQFEQRLQSVTIVGREVPTLCPADLLIYLSVQGARDLWQNLGAVCDIAALVKRHPELNWHQILVETQRLGIERMLLLGLSLAHQLLQLPLLDSVHQRLLAQPVVGTFTDRVILALYTSSAQPRLNLLARSQFYLSVLDRWQDRLKFCMQLFLRQLQLIGLINSKDYDFLPLPRPLYGLYYLIRPVRILSQHGLGLFKLLLP
jgi:hypothetical protein